MAQKALRWAVPWGAVPAVWKWVTKILFLMGSKNCAKVFWGWELWGIRDGGRTWLLGEEVKGE